MFDILKQQLTPKMNNEEKLNRLRDFLQLTALKIMYDHGYFKMLAFVGGTSLRFIYGLRRYSEDMDFSLVDKKGYDFAEINSKLSNEFKLYGLEAQLVPKQVKTVNSTFLKFSGVLKELGLFPLVGQKISVKIEIDTNPPKGWHSEVTYINKFYMLNILHYDISSLFASKLHACFFRKYTKGRDFYDLLWYLGKRTTPNFELLNNAIEQTQGKNLNITEANFKQFMLERLHSVDFQTVKNDVGRFLEDSVELELLNLETFTNLLGK